MIRNTKQVTVKNKKTNSSLDIVINDIERCLENGDERLDQALTKRIVNSINDSFSNYNEKTEELVRFLNSCINLLPIAFNLQNYTLIRALFSILEKEHHINELYGIQIELKKGCIVNEYLTVILSEITEIKKPDSTLILLFWDLIKLIYSNDVNLHVIFNICYPFFGLIDSILSNSDVFSDIKYIYDMVNNFIGITNGYDLLKDYVMMKLWNSTLLLLEDPIYEKSNAGLCVLGCLVENQNNSVIAQKMLSSQSIWQSIFGVDRDEYFIIEVIRIYETGAWKIVPSTFVITMFAKALFCLTLNSLQHGYRISDIRNICGFLYLYDLMRSLFDINELIEEIRRRVFKHDIVVLLILVMEFPMNDSQKGFISEKLIELSLNESFYRDIEVFLKDNDMHSSKIEQGFSSIKQNFIDSPNSNCLELFRDSLIGMNTPTEKALFLLSSGNLSHFYNIVKPVYQVPRVFDSTFINSFNSIFKNLDQLEKIEVLYHFGMDDDIFKAISHSASTFIIYMSSLTNHEYIISIITKLYNFSTELDTESLNQITNKLITMLLMQDRAKYESSILFIFNCIQNNQVILKTVIREFVKLFDDYVNQKSPKNPLSEFLFLLNHYENYANLCSFFQLSHYDELMPNNLASVMFNGRKVFVKIESSMPLYIIQSLISNIVHIPEENIIIESKTVIDPKYKCEDLDLDINKLVFTSNQQICVYSPSEDLCNIGFVDNVLEYVKNNDISCFDEYDDILAYLPTSKSIIDIVNNPTVFCQTIKKTNSIVFLKYLFETYYSQSKKSPELDLPNCINELIVVFQPRSNHLNMIGMFSMLFEKLLTKIPINNILCIIFDYAKNGSLLFDEFKKAFLFKENDAIPYILNDDSGFQYFVSLMCSQHWDLFIKLLESSSFPDMAFCIGAKLVYQENPKGYHICRCMSKKVASTHVFDSLFDYLLKRVCMSSEPIDELIGIIVNIHNDELLIKYMNKVELLIHEYQSRIPPIRLLTLFGELARSFSKGVDFIDRFINNYCNVSLNKWNYDIKTMSRKNDEYIGIKNLGATCYISSSLISFYYIEYLRNIFFSINEDKVINLINDTFYQLLLSKRPYANIDNFCKLWIGWDNKPIDVHEQQDIVEFMHRLIHGSPINIQNEFTGKLCKTIRDKKSQNNIEEEFVVLTIPIDGFSNADASIQSLFLEEEIGEKMLQNKIISCPNVLLVQLSRFQFDMYSGERIKKNDYFTFDNELTINNDSNSEEYCLQGIILHKGNANHGHYIPLIFINSKWVMFDDMDVSVVTETEKNSLSFGSGDTSAYILMYVKRSIFSKTSCIAISNDSQKLLDEDNALYLKELYCFNEDVISFVNRYGTLYQRIEYLFGVLIRSKYYPYIGDFIRNVESELINGLQDNILSIMIERSSSISESLCYSTNQIKNQIIGIIKKVSDRHSSFDSFPFYNSLVLHLSSTFNYIGQVLEISDILISVLKRNEMLLEKARESNWTEFIVNCIIGFYSLQKSESFYSNTDISPVYALFLMVLHKNDVSSVKELCNIKDMVPKIDKHMVQFSDAIKASYDKRIITLFDAYPIIKGRISNNEILSEILKFDRDASLSFDFCISQNTAFSMGISPEQYFKGLSSFLSNRRDLIPKYFLEYAQIICDSLFSNDQSIAFEQNKLVLFFVQKKYITDLHQLVEAIINRMNICPPTNYVYRCLSVILKESKYSRLCPSEYLINHLPSLSMNSDFSQWATYLFFSDNSITDHIVGLFFSEMEYDQMNRRPIVIKLLIKLFRELDDESLSKLVIDTLIPIMISFVFFCFNRNDTNDYLYMIQRMQRIDENIESVIAENLLEVIEIPTEDIINFISSFIPIFSKLENDRIYSFFEKMFKYLLSNPQVDIISSLNSFISQFSVISISIMSNYTKNLVLFYNLICNSREFANFLTSITKLSPKIAESFCEQIIFQNQSEWRYEQILLRKLKSSIDNNLESICVIIKSRIMETPSKSDLDVERALYLINNHRLSHEYLYQVFEFIRQQPWYNTLTPIMKKDIDKILK